MTIEERAEKYYDEKIYKPRKNKGCIDDYGDPFVGEDDVIDAYIAGAKENGFVWHDLRKDPNDLPKKIKEYLVSDGETSFKLQWYAWGWLGHRTDAVT